MVPRQSPLDEPSHLLEPMFLRSPSLSHTVSSNQTHFLYRKPMVPKEKSFQIIYADNDLKCQTRRNRLLGCSCRDLRLAPPTMLKRLTTCPELQLHNLWGYLLASEDTNMQTHTQIGDFRRKGSAKLNHCLFCFHNYKKYFPKVFTQNPT